MVDIKKEIEVEPHTEWMVEEEVSVLNNWVEELMAADDLGTTATLSESNEAKNSNTITCTYCSATFKLAKVYYRHCRGVHKIEPDLNRKPGIKCPICKNKFYNYEQLRSHVTSFHEQILSKSNLTFQTMEGNLIIFNI